MEVLLCNGRQSIIISSSSNFFSIIQSGIELSDSGSQITNRFSYVLSQKEHFNFFTNHKYNCNCEVFVTNKATTKTITKTWLAKVAVILLRRTKSICNYACNTDKTTLLSVIYDFVSLQC